MTAGEKLADDVAALVKSRNPIIWVVTAEEGRVERSLIDAVTRKARYEVRLWDCASGVTDVLGKELKKIGDRAFDGKSMTDIAEVLNAISANKERAVWILRDAPLPWLQDPQTRRRLRNLARELPDCERDDARSVIVLSPTAEVPPDLVDHAVVIKWELPDRAEIAGVLDKILEEIGPDLAATACPPAERDLAIEAAVGLTAEAASSSYSKSLVTQGKRILPAYVAVEKKRVVSGKGIEWFDADPRGLDALGGLEYLKPWLMETKLCFGPRARDFGLPAPKGVFLTGIPGCLASGTRIEYRRGDRASGAGRALPIDVFYDKFNGNARYRGGQWLPGLPTYLQSWDPQTGKIVYNEVSAVIDSGTKECLRVMTDVAGEVELTEDHPVLMENGTFCEAGKLFVGARLLVRGSMKPRKTKDKRSYSKRAVVEGLKYHPMAWRKFVIDKKSGKRYEYQRTTRARLVVEAEMNKIPYEEFVDILKRDAARAETLVYLQVEYDVHHKDEDPLNDSFDNLQVVLHEEHARHHSDEAIERFNRENTVTACVTAIFPIGERRTFDITMTEELPNFVVNDGIVVHNCGKSLSAKATATAFGCPLLRADFGASQSKWVGESQQNIRAVFAIAEAVGRCVLWIDEIEKSLAGATGGAADGGVSSDALGTFLQWMQERKGEVFVVATANDVTKLPPELLRKGRFDELFFVDLPTSSERADILQVTLRQFKRADHPVDVPVVVSATKEFTGSEIAALLPAALRKAYADGERQITTMDLVDAAKATVPLSRTMPEKIEALREWSKTRARPASLPEVSTTIKGGRKLDM